MKILCDVVPSCQLIRRAQTSAVVNFSQLVACGHGGQRQINKVDVAVEMELRERVRMVQCMRWLE